MTVQARTVVIVSLILEASVFISVTWLVRRPRPDVARLEGSPADSSFPSGHTAAAAAYSALVVVVFWHTRNRFARVAAVSICAVVTAIVGLSRMYRGMHYVTDVVAGVVLGVVCVAITAMILSHATLSHTTERRDVSRDARQLDGVS
ncbi:MAG TPA: phosphatase PAP2 family protein [Acidimicrobiales bacterium]|nr:phosphatase PAP2 family protein [Acidimicrobiales bacterium]